MGNSNATLINKLKDEIKFQEKAKNEGLKRNEAERNNLFEKERNINSEIVNDKNEIVKLNKEIEIINNNIEAKKIEINDFKESNKSEEYIELTDTYINNKTDKYYILLKEELKKNYKMRNDVEDKIVKYNQCIYKNELNLLYAESHIKDNYKEQDRICLICDENIRAYDKIIRSL